MDALTPAQAQDWLEQDEARSRPYRAARLVKLLAMSPVPEAGMLFSGGMASAQSFTEIRLAYIHGLYLSSVLLALSCIEQELAGALYGQGTDRAATARLDELLKDSLVAGIITEQEFQTFDHLRDIRNSYAHYRPVTHRAAWARRAMTTDTPIDDVLESDAAGALSALGSFLTRKPTF